MNKKSGMIKGLIIGVILIGLVGGYYYYLTNKREDRSKEETVKATVVQEVLMRNLDNNYPPTPREVVKYFGELVQCMIGECDLLPDCPAHGVWRRGAGNCLPQAHRKNKSGD